MLAFREDTVWYEWTGQHRPLNGAGSFQLPSNAEGIYSADELAAYGLCAVTPDTTPPGQRKVSYSIETQDGLPVEVAVFEPIPAETPTDYPLTARQLRLGLIRNGVALSAVQTAINNLPTQAQRDEAQVYWEFSTLIYWDHPMTQALMGLVGVTPQNAVAMWMIAKDYEA